MTGDPIPESDNVSRYCSPLRVDDRGMPLPQAFQLRRGEGSLSVNWLEYFTTGDLSIAIDMVRAAFHDRGFSLRPNGRFAVLNVAEVKAVGRENSISLLVQHDPRPDDGSHASILGILEDDFLVAVALAQLVRRENVYPAVV